MWAFIVALAVLMWMWGALCVHVVRPLGGGKEVKVRLAYLLLALASGAVVLSTLPYLVLPASVISHGWTQEMLRGTRHYALSVIALVAVAAFLRGRVLLLPAATPVRKSADILKK